MLISVKKTWELLSRCLTSHPRRTALAVVGLSVTIAMMFLGSTFFFFRTFISHRDWFGRFRNDSKGMDR